MGTISVDRYATYVVKKFTPFPCYNKQVNNNQQEKKKKQKEKKINNIRI